MKQRNNSNKGKGLVFAGLGMEIVGMMIGSVIVGREVDRYMGWNGYTVIILLLSSFGLWVWHIVAISKKFMKDMNNDGNT